MLRRSANYILFSLVFDLVITLAAVALAGSLRDTFHFGHPVDSERNLRLLFWQAGALYPLVFILLSIYDPERTFRAVDEYQALTVGSFIAGLALAGLVFFSAREISRLSLVYFFAIHFFLLIAWRTIARLVLKNRTEKGRAPHRVLLIGGGEAARHALERLHDFAWAGVELVGYLTDGDPIPSANGHIPRLGNLQAAETVVQTLDVDDVLLALPAESYTEVQKMVTRLIDKPCSLWVVPDYFSLLLYGSRVENLGGVSMISLKAPTLAGYQRVIKRGFDLIVGMLVLLPTLPVMAVIAFAIKLDSPGPILFKQQRVGENGRLFSMYKFRSMVSDAERRLTEVLHRDMDGHLIHKQADDPRITRIGRFLRQTSLDELPQLFNVMRGEMSLVGPRPELPLLVEQYEPWQRQRFAVPQGMTGWWQINGRSDRLMHLHTEDDLYYVQNYSLLLDLQILLKTVLVVLRGRGAY